MKMAVQVYLLLQELADYALTQIEDPDAPLFLRFINLLINDAIFLLDEAFQVSSFSKALNTDTRYGFPYV